MVRLETVKYYQVIFQELFRTYHRTYLHFACHQISKTLETGWFAIILVDKYDIPDVKRQKNDQK